MRWVAPTEKDEANHQLEKRLWAAADQFRANSGLKAEQYSTTVFGLVDLKEGKGEVVCGRVQLFKVTNDKEGLVSREGLMRLWTDRVDYWAVDFDYMRATRSLRRRAK
jgi:hypothetical protein